MRWWIVLLLNVVVFYSFAQKKEKAEKYISLYKDAAMQEMQRSGVPASITLAQGMLESGYGESELCKKSNNHFGIKCKNDWQGNKVYHDDDERGECFRAYANAFESYKDHSDFLLSRPWYAFLFKLDPTDYKAWAFGLKKAGYATEKNYAQLLIKIIEEFELNNYTLIALNKYNQDNSADTETLTTTTSTQTEETTVTVTKQTDTTVTSDTAKDYGRHHDEEVEPKEDTVVVVTAVVNINAEEKTKDHKYSVDSFYTINHAKAVFVEEGTSLLFIANKFNLSLASLFSFNDMPPLDVADSSRLYFIERKLKKGSTDFILITEEQSLHTISQNTGVQLDSLAEYNKLDKKTIVKAGTKIFLRPLNPKTSK